MVLLSCRWRSDIERSLVFLSNIIDHYFTQWLGVILEMTEYIITMQYFEYCQLYLYVYFRSSYHTFHLKLFDQWRLYWFTVWIQQRGQNPCYVGNGYGGAIELQCKQQCVVHESILVLKRNGRTGHVILMDTNKIYYTGALMLCINHRSEIEFWKPVVLFFIWITIAVITLSSTTIPVYM